MVNNMARFKIICLDAGQQEILKESDDIDYIINDMSFRDPTFYFIGDEVDKQGYTLEEFISKFRGE